MYCKLFYFYFSFICKYAIQPLAAHVFTLINYLSTQLPTYLPTYLPTNLPTYLPTYVSTHLPTYLSTHLPTYLSIYLSIYLRTPSQYGHFLWSPLSLHYINLKN